MRKFSSKIISLSATFILILLLLCCAIVAVADILGILDENLAILERIPAMTLLILTGISLYIFLDRASDIKEFDRIHSEINTSKSDLIEALSGVDMKIINNTEDAFDYLCQKYDGANSHIEQAAIAPSTRIDDATIQKYRKTIDQVLSKGKIRYTYVAVIDARRKESIDYHLKKFPNSKFVVRVYDDDIKIPVVSFTIVDGKEVIVRYPFSPGEQETWMAITHPQIVEFFKMYHRKLWENASEYHLQT